MSDIIVFQRDGKVESNYLDRFGYKYLPAFLGNENSQSDVVQPTVNERTQTATAEAAKAAPNLKTDGVPQRPAVQKGKPSLLDRLEKNKQRVAQGKTQGAQKNNEREV
jgi:hypothetical protein